MVELQLQSAVVVVLTGQQVLLISSVCASLLTAAVVGLSTRDSM